ncbi:MAG: hypothetical protein J4F40_17950 [Alphaproteobacteria bacterium]|nr:hypothetical protein [Alphaproteobacteria bacterium]
MTSVSFAPLLPWAVIGVFSAFAALLTAIAFRKHATGAGWRGAALAITIGALANPTLNTENRDLLTDVVAVVVDRSPSQRIGTRRERTDQTLRVVRERLQRLSNVEVRMIDAGTTGVGSSGQADAIGAAPEGTRLFSALDLALADIPVDRIAGAVFITDGQVHDAPHDPTRTPRVGNLKPLHVLLTGERGESDRRLVVAEAPSYGMVNSELQLTLRVEDAGGSERPGTAQVTLRRDGGREEIHTLEVGKDQRVPFKLDHGGQTIIEIEVADAGGELTQRNNRAALTVNGVRERLRVLLVSGEPHAGERTWRNLLKADPSVDLVHFTILRPPEKQDGTPVRELSLIAFPIRELFETKLTDFDLIIFDRYRRRGVLPQSYFVNIVRYITEGGALLGAVGPAFATPLSVYQTPLKAVMPGRPTGEVIEQGFRPMLTTLGERHPVTADLAGTAAEAPEWGRWFRMIDAVVESGTTVMQGVNNRPLLQLDRIGDGRVALLLSDHAWLWARGAEGGGPQAELLRRLAHWLMKEPDLEEEDLKLSTRGNRLDITRRSLGASPEQVTVGTPSDDRLPVKLEDQGGGRAIGSATVSETGLYTVSDGDLEAVTVVGALNAQEYADVRTSPDTLMPVVQATSGGIYWIAEDGVPNMRLVRPGRDTSGSDWLGLIANRSYIVTGVEQTSLFPALAVLLLALGALMMAWHREGR